MNPFETACREWLKGCSCCEKSHPEQCQECTEALLAAVKRIATEEASREPELWAVIPGVGHGKVLNAKEILGLMKKP